VTRPLQCERNEVMESQLSTVSTERLNRAFISTCAILNKVHTDDLELPTPCASWDVGALISHFVGSAR
jgi:hypothetical protein